MTMKLRVLAGMLVLLAALFEAGCGGSYNCQVTFGSSSCTPSGSGGPGSGGGGGGGGGGSLPTAFVFAVDQNGTIDGYTLNSTLGTLGITNGYLAPTIPTNDGGVGMVVAQNQFLYVGMGATDQLYGWTISATGTLTTIPGSPFSAPFLNSNGFGVGQADMITDPAGTTLYISDRLSNLIYVYTIGTNGVLAAAAGSPFTVPFIPLNLATDGLGKYLYVINGDYTTHTGSQIAAYVIGNPGSSTLTLTAVPGSPFSGSSPNFQMWMLKGEPTGSFMIGTTGNSAAPGFSGTDDDHLYAFSITPSGTNAGALTPVPGSPFATVYSPFAIAVQPDPGGDLVYSFSFNDTGTAFNGTEGYTVSNTGVLTAVANSPFGNIGEGSWGQFDQSGTLLFVYASYTDLTTSEIVTTLAPLYVTPATGALTQPVPTLTLQTPGFWVVTDPQ